MDFVVSSGTIPGPVGFRTMKEHSENSRREAVLELLKENTSASISEIAEQFRVSQMTIRRDLQKLVEAGQVIRIPTGARIERWHGMERTFLERLENMSPAKRAIGKAAPALVQDGQTVGLGCGPTTPSCAPGGPR